MARSSDCTEEYAQKVIDSAGIVREAILRQLPHPLDPLSRTASEYRGQILDLLTPKQLPAIVLQMEFTPAGHFPGRQRSGPGCSFEKGGVLAPFPVFTIE
jgi:hypothetical protein